eukprot:jgi/Mesen1/7193/ME000371S06281
MLVRQRSPEEVPRNLVAGCLHGLRASLESLLAEGHKAQSAEGVVWALRCLQSAASVEGAAASDDSPCQVRRPCNHLLCFPSLLAPCHTLPRASGGEVTICHSVL